MENNFLDWLMKPVTHNEIEVWFNMNNMIHEKIELFYNFSLSLYQLINDTYLGEERENITKIFLTEKEKIDHFNWCWEKNIENFSKENLFFNVNGDHYDYYSSFFKDAFYLQNNDKVRGSIESFFIGLFTNFNNYTKSDLDMITEIYKMLDKNLIKKNFTKN